MNRCYNTTSTETNVRVTEPLLKLKVSLLTLDLHSPATTNRNSWAQHDKNSRKDINGQRIILDPIASERKTIYVEICLLKLTLKKNTNRKSKTIKGSCEPTRE